MTVKSFLCDLFFVVGLAFVLFCFGIGLMTLISNHVYGAPPTTYRDRQGRMVGTSTSNGKTTVYRDRLGRTAGSATTSGNTTIYRDRLGREVLQQSGKTHQPIPLLPSKGKK